MKRKQWFASASNACYVFHVILIKFLLKQKNTSIIDVLIDLSPKHSSFIYRTYCWFTFRYFNSIDIIQSQ